MWILAFFTNNGEPALGLNPLVKVLDVETGLTVVNNESMVETGDGFYKYSFDAYEPARDYAVICDSVTLSGSERYTYASSGEYSEVLDSIESTVGLVDVRTVLLRKIQTNRLELADGDTDNWVLYDDDKTTPLLTFSVKDKSGDLIVQQPHTPSRRGMATGDVCGSGISPSIEIYMRKSVYDPDEDGIVNVSEAVSDGVYTSTASGIKFAVDNAHHQCYLGTKCIDESGIGDQFVVKYDAASDRLIYGVSNISGTLSGTIPHNWLLKLDYDDHPQYILVDGTRAFTSTVSGVDPVVDDHLTTKRYVDDKISTISGNLSSNYYTKQEVLDLIGQNQAGIVKLNYNDDQTIVTFNTAFTSDDYALLVSVDNVYDSEPSEYAMTIVDKTTSGFKVRYSGKIDSDNYTLNWYATLSGVAGGVTRGLSRGLVGSNTIKQIEKDFTVLPAGNYTIHKIPESKSMDELNSSMELCNNSVVLNTTPSGYMTHGYIVGWSGDVSTVNIQENFNGFGIPMYVQSNGKFGMCMAASGTNQMPCIALSLEEGTGYKQVLWKGIARKGSWHWKPGNIIYVSTVEGALTNKKPIDGSWVQPIGIAIASDTIRFDPGFNVGINK